MKEYYSLGLDIGISSVGWSVVALDEKENAKRIIDLGVRTFTPGEDSDGESFNKTRREKRGARRVISRRSHRLDRIRQLLDEHNIIDIDASTNNFSEFSKIAKEYTNELINNYYKKNKTNPFLLKVKGLDYKLTNEELVIVLLHYGKYRGYKSNREDKSEAKSSEQGKVLSAIKENEELIKKYRTVSEMFVKDPKFAKRIHNTTDDYKMCVTREMFLDEINLLLDKQIEFGTISEKFKNEYIDIWGAQRSYAKGPGGNSKYGAKDGEELIDRMIGTCKFTGEKRAPKNAPSVEKFIALQNLANFRYSDDTSTEYKALTKEQKQDIINALEKQDKITYKKLANIIGIKNMKVKGLKLARPDFLKAKKKLEEKLKVDKIDTRNLNTEEQKMLEEIKEDILLSKPFLKMPTYTYFRKEITKQFGSSEWENFSKNYMLMDEIIRLLTIYKTDDTLLEQLKNNSIIDEKYYDFILSMPNYKEHIKLSLKLIYDLIPLLYEGYRYDEAMLKLGYNPYDVTRKKQKFDLLPGIMIDKNINNQRVIRALSQARKVVNAVIKTYGTPKIINIEVARELSKNKIERMLIERENLENREKNEKDKEYLVKTFNEYFKTPDDVKPYDLLKYRLWIEQDEYCPYSLEKIKIEELFDNNLVQVDHILPYSRTGNDNYLNKTLVKTKANQDKGNRTPYEWLKDTEKYKKFENFILNSNKIPHEKTVNYLFKNLTPEKEKEFKEQNLNDTKYISKYFASFIKAYLNVDKVNMIKGAITAKLRARWGLNGLTHSLESHTYRLIDAPNYDKEKVDKNRENVLHHVLDATIVAVTTKSLIKRVTDYEKYKRYLRDYKIGKKVDFENLNKNIIYYKKETGEILDEKELDEFLDEAIKKEFLVKNKNDYRLFYPVPYKDFVQEVKLRIYERDVNKLRKELSLLDNYQGINLNEIDVIIPTIAHNKISGALHKETYYGMKTINNEIYLTERLAVNNKRFTEDTINKMIEVDGGSKEVANTLRNWLKGYSNGEQAYKAKGYPRNEKSGNLIKKVKIIKRSFNYKGHILDGNKIVEVDTIHKIGIYTRENSDLLYFVGFDLLTLKKIQQNKIDNLMVTVWWGSGNNNETLPYNEFVQKYNLYLEIFKNDLILMELKNGNKGLCYVVGFTGGKIEVKDILGDGYDLVNSGLFDSLLSRYYKTISSIKTIKKIHITTLGKINRQYQLT
ncbi:MAG: type II CRISPR RNA-guided endonuclease Cas9 [Mollicutes bacterium]|nr:type II CRISPR RNA-guided endonuclease Cas9 [Mollicutes bacterium]